MGDGAFGRNGFSLNLGKGVVASPLRGLFLRHEWVDERVYSGRLGNFRSVEIFDGGGRGCCKFGTSKGTMRVSTETEGEAH